MQKKLLTTAIGAMLAGPAIVAHADVTVYGRAQFEWAQVQNDSNYYAFGSNSTGVGSWNNGTVPANTTRSGTLDSKMGRFGIKADEDLGGGWKGVATFEWQVDTADGVDGAVDSGTKGSAATTITDRVQYVGLSHKAIGTLRFGQDNTPYKNSGTALDPFVSTTLEARNNYGMSGNRDGWSVMNAHNNFAQDGLFFDSASWGGAYVNLYLGLDRTGTDSACTTGLINNNCDAAGNNNGKNNGDINAVAGWKGDLGPVGLNLFLGYAEMNNTNSNNLSPTEPTAVKLGGQITFVKTQTLSLQYEMTDRADFDGYLGDGIDEADYLFLGYAGKFGPVTAVAQYGMMTTGSYAGLLDYEGTYMALGAIYNFSKTFRTFAGWRQTELDLNIVGISATVRDDSVLSIGLRKDF
jgi:predicted porin